MRNYNFIKRYKELLTPDIVALVSQIQELKGKQNAFLEVEADTLTQLVEIAKIQSTEASNKIEGIYTSDERLNLIVRDKTSPQNRSEQEIAGYRDVLNTIHENHEYIFVKPTFVLQLHRDLYKFIGANGGRYKSVDNVIAEEDNEGNKTVRFVPVPAWEVSDAIENLCFAYDEAFRNEEINNLLLIPMFILDFLCIHPFNDGNGRMSRLLTLLLLYRCGYNVGKYISIEKIIEKTKDLYYESLQDSSIDWHNEENDYSHFVRYMLGVIVSAYKEFDQRVQALATKGLSKPERVASVIKDTLGKITKSEIMEKCPDISQVTIQRALIDLVNSGKILKIGGGRYTSYVWNGDK